MHNRIFFAPFSPGDDEFSVSGDEFFHMTTVMRLKSGDHVEVVNGQGGWCEAEIGMVGARSLRLRVLHWRQEEQPKLKMVLAPALPRSNQTGWMMEKLAEIGVDQVRPIVCERSEIKRKASFPVEKWSKIAGQALKVNRRLWLTEIMVPEKLDKLLHDQGAYAGKYFLDTEGEKREMGKGGFPVLVLVGPPGDFSQSEKKCIRDAGFIGIRINDAILRTETAAVSVAAILKYD